MARRATPKPDEPAIVWFRNDLRLGDQPALAAAVASGRPVLPVFVFDQDSAGLRPLGGASRWWLHGSLASLSEALAALGSRLHLFAGPAAEVLPWLVEAAGARAVFWSRRYGEAERRVDEAVADTLTARGVAIETFNGTLLHEPDEVRPKAGGLFKVFTPFKRASMALGDVGSPVPAPRSIVPFAPKHALDHATTLEALDLLPRHPDWARGLRETWAPGEAAAQALLAAFLDAGLDHYGDGRNRPALPATSRLSPHLRFGEISPRQIAARALQAAHDNRAPTAEVDKFLSEVIWRDFSYNLLVQFPAVADTAIQPAFADFPYRKVSATERQAWRHGRTGYPIVDAGMRQLWRTGVMHNRVRMITASFLVKHMLADWREGEAWFWDTLCDADPASNPVNWQWVAGSGADPSPYFRIFNPVLQGEKFDPDGTYVRTHVPELEQCPAKWIHRPWEAPKAVLDGAGIRIGETYPKPIVDHEAARVRALAALAATRRGAQAT